MSTVKDLLKEAKSELAREDYEEAAKISLKVLKLDQCNYFAQVFLGKSYSCLDGKAKEAVYHYRAAIELAPENLLAWKGLFLFLNAGTVVPEVVSYDEYFDLSGEYARILSEQQQSQVELVHELRMLQKKKPESRESFLWHMVPGTPMAEQLGRHLISSQVALKELIDILDSKEKAYVSKIVSRERLKFSAQDPDYQIKMNSLAWDVYQNSKLDHLFNQLINITDDDDERAELETRWLEYRMQVLKSMPKEIKSSFYEQVKRMVDDMVLVDHRSATAWRLYFEWQDYADLDNMDQELILKFFKKFPLEPLAIILYAWLSSNLSKYDIKKLNTSLDQPSEQEDGRELADIDESEKNALNDMMEKDNETSGLLEDEVVDALLDNIPKAQNSILANRIVSQYYLLSKEYEAALPYVKTGISVIAYKIRDLGGRFANSKKQFTLSLAILYTYIDPPKNHNAALSLFEKILADDPDNTHAKLGKGLIFVEREEWTKANVLLSEVSAQFPDNMEVLSELAWNEVQLGLLEDALSKFKTVLAASEGTDLRSAEFRALNLWRQAKVYIMLEERDGSENLDHVKVAFKQLVNSIKALDTFADNYSTLGDIYCSFFHDKVRAFKCYYKAFELNARDVTAAKYMAEHYANLANWQAACTVAKRLISAETNRKKLRDVNWAYRVVGIFYLETQDEAASIEWFQGALRIEPNDVESLVGLGQAYHACGRVEASIKVFDRALEIDSEHFHCQYLKAQSLAAMGEYVDSINILKRITALSPTEEVYQIMLASVSADYAMDLYSQGLLTKSIATAEGVIENLRYAIVELHCGGQLLWLVLSKALGLFVTIASKVDNLPIESLVDIFRSLDATESIRVIDDIDGVSFDRVLSAIDDSNISIACKFLILSAKYSFSTTKLEEQSRTVRSSLWHNVGSAELTAYHVLKEAKYRDAAITCYKASIQQQSNAVESWVGLGVATMDVNYRVAQHCFIKASALSPRDADVWFDLAVLGLKNNDVEFSRDVLNRSQSLSPQNSSPWLGFALVHEMEGNIVDSHRMFAHAFVLSNGKSKVAQLLYAKSVLDRRIGNSFDERDLEAAEELTAAAYGLDQYFKENPRDNFALQCALLIFERLHLYPNALRISKDLVELLEIKFEKAQSDEDLYNYAIIKAQIARIKLGFGEYQAAIDDAKISESILTEFAGRDTSKISLSNQISLSLANFFLQNYDETLQSLQEILKASKTSRHLSILTAKILYDMGSDEAKEIALEELMEYVSQNGPELLVSFTIAAIAIVEEKTEDLKLILGELTGMSLSSLIADKHNDLPYLIEQIKARLPLKNKTVTSWQRSSFFFMNDHSTWTAVDKKISLRVAADGQNKINANQLSTLYCMQKDVRSVQRSLFLAPWNKTAISTLRQCF
ncbi:hypothetical protein HG537_0A08930 [Torulaspora globosa]|uniref:Superkiller protein 3 n=1 Tax=Torulaspora globosa TaxID=48254 RepID=A0A7H9HQL9_9SACH|nr:hypothetical protein HG537_0A08930 [Torulaspora sp. CBS 2947]